ncbi:threonine synthase [Ralstonia solanacearum]|nr:threonine synthase [Ralstonia solanacearum]AMP71061.1 threonine synthase [Ralstonia solanacearum]AMP75718.1 threonine synthase [Ralstonia solanacearum]MBB6587605.1 threonine synthase [Ralstonia solanacearum]MCG3574183.1 threonine synthase [Ralstonia solanacearum]MCL9824896.1 threonine synthase [Ralstonia solanacearum]
MQYRSTRGHAEPQSFSRILLGGLAPDGGLYLPEQYPQVSVEELTRWRDLPYADLAFEILRKFATDIPEDDLRALARRTYTPEVYCNARNGDRTADITPLHRLGEEGGTSLSLLCLSNGPTLAFKDMAMQLLGNLFEYALDREHAELNILGATSGDTGSAAEYAMRGKRGVRVFMLSPHRKMSAFQTAQMFSLQDQNIFNIAIEGVFDDAQDIVKAVSNDLEYKARQKIGTVNSINWARVVAQVVYYFKGYLLATTPTDNPPGQVGAPPSKPPAGRGEESLGALPKVSFCVPSGNFGNVCAGHIARMMGLPIDKLVVATNENDVLDEFFRTGTYRVRSAAQTYHTSSPSMDISKASNFERFVFDLLERDPARLVQLFRDVEEKGGFSLTGKPEFDRIAAFGFVSGRSTHEDRVNTIRDVFARYGAMIDTHTADGVKVAREHLSPGVPMVVLETALPAKFGDTIREALDREPERPAGYADIESLQQRFEVMPADADRVKAYIVQHTGL